MNNKRTIAISIFFIFFSHFFLSAQRNGLLNNENTSALIFTIGPSYCFGDIGGSKANASIFDDIHLEHARYALSLGFRRTFYNRLAYRISLHQGLYYSKDVGSFAVSRKYESSSNIIEIIALAEFNILQGFIKKHPYKLYMYSGGGLTCAFINIKGNPVAAPNQSKTSEFAPVIPLGFGFDIQANSNFSFGLEMGWQYAFSDYMDGVKTGRENYTNDILANISLTLSYKILEKNKYWQR